MKYTQINRFKWKEGEKENKYKNENKWFFFMSIKEAGKLRTKWYKSVIIFQITVVPSFLRQ